MLTGRLLAESLRPGYDLRIADLNVVRLGRHDVTASTLPGADDEPASEGAGATASQPSIWTFVDFEAPDERADELAQALADALLTDDGWWADFKVGDDRVIVFSGKVFRYRIGDAEGREAAIQHGLAVGTPRHQLDWGD